MSLLSDLGETAVLIPLAFVGGAYLYATAHRSEAVFLWLSAAVTSAFILVLKFFFLTLSCGQGFGTMESPSGHSALSFAVYGAFGLLMLLRMKGRARYVPFILMNGLALAIALSRVSAQLHSPAEVVVGVITGATVLFSLWRFVLLRKRGLVANRREPKLIRLLALPLVGTAIIALSVGEKHSAEQSIRYYSIQLGYALSLCGK